MLHLLLFLHTYTEKLSAYFNAFGEVVNVVVMTNAETGRSRGFGFVEFQDIESVQNVLNHSPHELDGRNVSVHFTNKTK